VSASESDEHLGGFIVEDPPSEDEEDREEKGSDSDSEGDGVGGLEARGGNLMVPGSGADGGGEDGPQQEDPEEEADGGSHSLSHAALHFRLQHAEDRRDITNLIAATTGGTLSHEEAFAVWLEDLAYQARAYVDGGGAGAGARPSTPRQRRAAGRIERPLCTRRESTLGSSAWRADFVRDLAGRPVYRSVELPEQAAAERCGACGRCSHRLTHRIELGGPAYDSRRTWEVSRDLGHADWDACLREREGQGEEGGPELTTLTYLVGGHCRARTGLYHSLLHYKFRVFDSICGMLAGTNSTVATRMMEKENGQTLDPFLRSKRGRVEKQESTLDAEEVDGASNHPNRLMPMSVEELIENTAFTEREYQRCGSLLQEAEEAWGSAKGEIFQNDPKRMSGCAGKKHMVRIVDGKNKKKRLKPLEKRQQTLTFMKGEV
jgi:hypothetical protein